jgi:hypothetical protein
VVLYVSEKYMDIKLLNTSDVSLGKDLLMRAVPAYPRDG